LENVKIDKKCTYQVILFYNHSSRKSESEKSQVSPIFKTGVTTMSSISAVFAFAQCPSARLSITLVHYIQTAEDIVKFLSQPSSPIILVFFNPKRCTQFQSEPLPQGRKLQGMGKFCDFRLKSPFISETVPDGCYGTLIGNCRCMRIDMCRFR